MDLQKNIFGQNLRLLKEGIIMEKFRTKFQRIDGSLHLELIGDFDGNSAWELANMIILNHGGQERVVINTEKLRKVIPIGSVVFKSLMKNELMPVGNMVFEGVKASEISRGLSE
jgi:hypothetical protein